MHAAITPIYKARLPSLPDVATSIILLQTMTNVKEAATCAMPRTELRTTRQRTPDDARHIHFMLSRVLNFNNLFDSYEYITHSCDEIEYPCQRNVGRGDREHPSDSSGVLGKGM